MSEVADLFRALEQKTHFEVVEHTTGAHQLRIIGRIPADAAGQYMQNWLIIARNLLIASATATWKADISKQYFLKGPANAQKIVYGHRLIIQGENVAQHYDEIIALVLGSKPSAVTSVDSFPLTGASSTRNAPKNGRGAVAISGSPSRGAR